MPVMDPEKLIFLDEMGALTNLTTLYGRTPKGERVVEVVLAGDWETRLVGATRLDGPCAPMLLEGAIDGESFLA
jgi:hypothetical protein